MNDTLILVDARNLAYRAYFQNKGVVNGAVYGFGAMLVDLIREAQTRHILVCWDNGVPGVDKPAMLWRKKLDPRYKANRVEDDPDRLRLLAQLPRIAQLMGKCGYGQAGVPGVEADDLISIVAHRLIRHKLWEKVSIYSNDSDYFGLLRDGLTIMQPDFKHGGIKLVTEATLLRDTGLEPWQYPYLKALAGDTADCVPGLPKCGPVHAKRALALGADPSQEWDAQPDALKAKYPRFADHWRAAQLSYELVRLPRAAADVPLHAAAIHTALARVPLILQAGALTKENASLRASGLVEWLTAEMLPLLMLRRATLLNSKPVYFPYE